MEEALLGEVKMNCDTCQYRIDAMEHIDHHHHHDHDHDHDHDHHDTITIIHMTWRRRSMILFLAGTSDARALALRLKKAGYNSLQPL